MYTLVSILTIIAALLLIVVVLVQKSKGGGLSSSFGGGNQIMGVRKTTDFIENATRTLAGIICVLAIISAFVMPRNVATESRVQAAEAPLQVTGTEYATPAQSADAPVVEEVAAPAESAE